MTPPYAEGQFFLLPVERRIYTLGLIARVPVRGGVLLGYFFGPRHRQAPVVDWLNALGPRSAVLACRFKDTALYRGEWQLLGMREPFRREDWPIPAFHRFDGSTTHAPGSEATADWRVEYGEQSLIVPTRESPARPEDLKLAEDVAFDPALLAAEVARRVTEMVPTADDASWR